MDCRVSGIFIVAFLLILPIGDLSVFAENKIMKNSEPDEIIFTLRSYNTRDNHWYANFGYYAHGEAATGKFGRLCRLNLKSGDVVTLLDDPAGAIRDPQMHYDGDKILFSYRMGSSDNFDLYEINTDGTGLRQITGDQWDDFEPTYLPDGGIAFCSNRCKRWVPCYVTQVATIYRCDGDGTNIRPLSANVEQDNHPWMLEDGRVIYTRWEYSDRSFMHYHHLWCMNPDGTRQRVYYGNQQPGDVYIDAKPIPGTQQIVFIDSPKHGRREHMGNLAIVDVERGPDCETGMTIIAEGNYRDPYPVSTTEFLAADKTELLLIDKTGTRRTIYTVPKELAGQDVWVHEPRPLQPRTRERVMPSQVDLAKSTGTIIVNDVYAGRNMASVTKGAVAKLLVMEHLPIPMSYSGGMEPITYGGSFFINRILGTVPVEPDGSVYAEVPADRPLQLVALDKNDFSVKRMQSFFTVMPGETISCVGCHEDRTMVPVNLPSIQAVRRQPSSIVPINDMPEMFDYPRDIQPIWDTYCLGCHDVDTRAGGVLMTGDEGPIVQHSYFMLTIRLQVADGRTLALSNLPPYKFGSSASYLMQKVDGSHYGVRVTDHELRKIKLWIDASGIYAGTYAALGSGMFGGETPTAKPFPKTTNLRGKDWPSSRAAGEAIDRRCGSCHAGDMQLPRYPSDFMKLKIHHMHFYDTDEYSWIPPWLRDYNDHRPGSLAWAKAHLDPRNVYSHAILFNLSRPEKSVILLAPLAKSAGGYEACGGIVFQDTSDPDYKTILKNIRDAHDELQRITRFNMAGFRPPPEYIREMKRYGILREGYKPGDPIDVYATDKKYWESFYTEPAHE